MPSKRKNRKPSNKEVGVKLVIFTTLLAVISTFSDLLSLPEIRDFFHLKKTSDAVTLVSDLHRSRSVDIVKNMRSFFNAARDNDSSIIQKLTASKDWLLYKEAVTKSGETALHIAAQRGNYDVAQLLLMNGVNANIRNRKDWTPLHHAIRFNHVDVAELLMKHGANLLLINSDGFTPLSLSIDELTQHNYLLFYNGIISNSSKN